MTSRIVGCSVPRVDGVAKVKGEAKYPGDWYLPHMLYAKVLWSQYPHARLVEIDTSRAENALGVVRVLTHRDVPNNEFGIAEFDQHVLAEDVVRWVGEPVALVVAESESAAQTACELIDVLYEPLPVIDDPIVAMDDSTLLIHPERGSNTVGRNRVERGDVFKALRTAEVVIEGQYRTPHVEHAFLQPEAGLAYIDNEGRVTVIVGAQWPHDDVRQIAHALGLPRDKVREIVPAVGGAFGGREDISLQILVALASWKTGRPVKLVWSREESIRGHGKRHPFRMQYRWGATRGRIVVADISIVADAGPYTSTTRMVLDAATAMAAGPYKIPNVRIDAVAVYTNNPVGMAMRGFGAPQVAVASEQIVDKLAIAQGIDPVQFRLDNLIDDGSTLPTGSPGPRGVGIKEALLKAAVAGGWKRQGQHLLKPARRKLEDGRYWGIGIACCFKNVGYRAIHADQSTATVELSLDKAGNITNVHIAIGASEVGMGVHTVLTQLAAETLGIAVSKVHLHPIDTGKVPDAGSCSASRQTYVSGNAVVRACREALKQARRSVSGTIGKEREKNRRTTKVELTYRVDTGDITSMSEAEMHFAYRSYGYCAQVAEVAVDSSTGQVEVLRIVSAQDVGRAINPAMIEGQVGGSVQMGLGFALMEELIVSQGVVNTNNLTEYIMPTALDMPELTTIIVETPDLFGPYGAKGMGEMPTLPTAPAIMSAIRDAIGVEVYELPAKAEYVWRHVRRKGMV